MRRIYESSAVDRDDDDPFRPNNREEKEEHQAMRTVPSTYLSRLLVPHRLRHWAIAVTVSTPRDEFTVGEDVPFAVTMKNKLPIPITLPVRSPIPWDWDVNGLVQASHVEVRNPPDEERGYRFGRGERKQHFRQWQGMFRVSESEWEPATAGEYTIGAGINIDDAAKKGLYDETTVTLVPE